MPDEISEHSPEDGYARGFGHHALGAFTCFVLLVVVGILVSPNYGSLFIFIFGIPGSVVLSGIANGIYFTIRKCPEAALINWILAGSAFLITGVCTFMIFPR